MNPTCLQLVKARLKKAEHELTQANSLCESYRLQYEQKLKEREHIAAEVEDLQAFVNVFAGLVHQQAPAAAEEVPL